jgi:phosphatidylserine synthase
MLDGILYPAAQKIVQPWSARILQSGMGANKITAFGLFFGVLGCFAAGMSLYLLALLLMIVSLGLSLIGKTVARETGKTRNGAALDILSDFFIYGLFVFLFSLSVYGNNSTGAAVFLLFSYFLMAVVYFLSTIAQGADILNLPKGGLVEKSEMAIFMIVCCAVPIAFPAFAAVFGLLCLTTALIRGVKMVRG